jgi:hypothetical protein
MRQRKPKQRRLDRAECCRSHRGEREPLAPMNLCFASRPSSVVVLSLLCLLSAPLHAAPDTPPGAPAPTDTEATADYARARALYRKASAAFETGHYTDARELLLRAWALRRSYDVAASLGDTELKLALFADAAEHLAFSLRTFPPLENEQALANVRQQLELARIEVAELRISVDEPGAEVRVDGRAVGTSPLADAVFVTPGSHTVDARKGGATATRTVMGEASKSSTLALELTATPQPSFPRDELGPRSVVPLIVGGAVVVAGLTAGVAFRLSADADDNHANGLRDRLGPGGCIGSAGASADCGALRHDVDASGRFQALSTTGFVIAGVGLAVTPIWWLLSPRTKRTSTVGLSALVTRSVTAVSATGRF